MIISRRALMARSALVGLCISPPLNAIAAPRSYKGQDLTGRDFSGRDLAGADFSEANLQDAHFSGCNLRGANFRGANLHLAWLAGAVLAGADLRETIGPYVANSVGTDFTQANLEGLDLKKTMFNHADFRNANLRDTNGWGLISNCDFRGADVRKANFRSAMVPGANPGSQKNYWPNFEGALYNKDTVWPPWYDAEESGARLAR